MAEFDIIKRIRRAVGPPGPGTLVGLGDDAAVYEPAGRLELLTADAFVENVHFRRDFAGFREIGAKCMVANVSDIAAMGGLPARATISVCIPSDMAEDDVDELYAGALEVCRAYGCEIVGGDTVGSPCGLVVSVALVGSVARDRLVTRAGAVAGDAVVVTGELGGSEAGLRALVEGLSGDGSLADARRRHLSPTARVAEAQAILDVTTPHAMIDISDGLSSDAWHIAEESGVGIELHEAAIPISPDARRVAEVLGMDPLELTLGSGEEFELLMAVPPSEVESTREHVRAVTGVAMTRIGDVVGSGSGCTIAGVDGRRARLARTGYEHTIGGKGGSNTRRGAPG